MKQVGLEAHWLEVLRLYIRPLQELVFTGYFHDVCVCLAGNSVLPHMHRLSSVSSLMGSLYLQERLCSKFRREAGIVHLLVILVVICDEILYWRSALSVGQVSFNFVCNGYHLQLYIYNLCHN